MGSETDEYEFKFKVAVVGDSGVGKHTMLEKASMEVLDNKLVESMGVKISVYNIQTRADFDGHKDVFAKIVLWGITANLKDGRFRDRMEGGVQGVMIMADASREETVKNARLWVERMEKIHDLDDIDMILILNKVDLVDKEELLRVGLWMREYAEEYEVPLILTSCETDLNLKKPFREVARRMCRRHLETEKAKYRKGGGK
jgi:Ras-related protein Rab-1A